LAKDGSRKEGGQIALFVLRCPTKEIESVQRSESGETNGEENQKDREYPAKADQEQRINAIVERSAILDTSKFVRIAVDWLLRSDIGEVIKTIVDDEVAFPDYQIPKKPAGRIKGTRKRRTGSAE